MEKLVETGIEIRRKLLYRIDKIFINVLTIIFKDTE